MAIVKMKRLRLVALREAQETLLLRLQRAGCVEITAGERCLADPACPQHAYRKIRQFPPLDSREREIIDLLPLHNALHLPNGHQHQHDRIIRHTLR